MRGAGSTETGRVPGLEEMADRLAIQEVLAKHSRGVDRADAATLESTYWPDGTVAYGGFNGSASEFCAMLPDAIRAWARTQHTLSNTCIEFRGARALVETYVTAYHYQAGDGGDTEMTYLGRYLDTMERRHGVWKILHRQVVMDWNRHTAATAVMEGPPFDGLAQGARHPDDPLDRLLDD
ncbi:MAG: nuclear transport factor 2 family protein [Pseudomonadota bacterium]